MLHRRRNDCGVLPPGRILSLLNELFDLLAGATDALRGRIFHVAGDGLMAGFGIDVGIHLGEVAVGFIGPPDRQAATMVGATVNVAARLCGHARAGEVLFSAAIAAALDIDHSQHARQTLSRLLRFALRGRSESRSISGACLRRHAWRSERGPSGRAAHCRNRAS